MMKPVTPMAIAYRPEIDGLRAVAVMLVILYHADVPLLSGGYVGVDVFFVISGYLITRILLNDADNHGPSIIAFYERRIRRIFPALFLVLAISSLAALWIMMPVELARYADSLLSATFFYSNYYFMFDGGYFASPSEAKPLLHVWSLAVEEQFYLIFPLYLFLVFKWRRADIRGISISLLLISLIYGEWLVRMQPDAAFYSTMGRAWELLLGAVLALVPLRNSVGGWLANAVTLAGLAMILCSAGLYTDSTPFPGLNALLPTVGAAFIIGAGRVKNNITGWLLGSVPFRFLGQISYSLYLWHWPLIVYYGLWKIEEVTYVETIGLMTAAVVLSALTWKYVEIPFRRKHFVPRRRGVIMMGTAAMICVGLIAAVVADLKGLPDRIPAEALKIHAVKDDVKHQQECAEYLTPEDSRLYVCRIGVQDAVKASFAVWGDSHAEALLPAIHQAALRYGMGGIFAGRRGCPPMLDVNQVRDGFDDCALSADAFLSHLQLNAQIDHVILASRWAIYAMGERFLNEPGPVVYIKDSISRNNSLVENRQVFRRGLERTVSQLDSMGKKIVVVSQVPETEFDVPTAAARAILLHREIELRPLSGAYARRQYYVTKVVQDLERKYPLVVVNPSTQMCGNSRCRVFRNGVPIYRDSSHITESYAITLTELFDPIFSGMSK